MDLAEVIAKLVTSTAEALDILGGAASGHRVNPNGFLKGIERLTPPLVEHATRTRKGLAPVLARHAEIEDDDLVSRAWQAATGAVKFETLTAELGSRLSDEALQAALEHNNHQLTAAIVTLGLGSPGTQKQALSGRASSGTVNDTRLIRFADEALERVAATEWGADALCGSVNETALAAAWRRWGRDPRRGRQILTNLQEAMRHETNVFGAADLRHFAAACDDLGNRISRRLLEEAFAGDNSEQILGFDVDEIADEDFRADAPPAGRDRALSFSLGIRAAVEAARRSPITPDEADKMTQKVNTWDVTHHSVRFLWEGPDCLGRKLGLLDDGEPAPANEFEIRARIVDRYGTPDAIRKVGANCLTSKGVESLRRVVGDERIYELVTALQIIEATPGDDVVEWLRTQKVDPMLFSQMVIRASHNGISAADLAAVCRRDGT